MKVVIIDYGMSNLGSIKNALIECGGQNVEVATKPSQLELSTHIILPGVGSFKDGISNLRNMGWEKVLYQYTKIQKIPLLGICLGMQLLASKGEEGGDMDGLGLIDGTVKKMVATNQRERIPHVGWNEAYPTKENPLFSGIPSGTDFYFVHSYQFVPKDTDNILSTTPYCGNFVSSIRLNNIFGTQFHPEKSQRPGFQLLKNFLGF